MATKAPTKTAAKSAAKTATKTAGKTTSKATAKPATAARKPAPRAPAKTKTVAEPSMRFYHSQELRERTFALLDAIESSPGHHQHGDRMADLVAELIEAGMDYYFMRGLKQAKVGFLVEQSARMGMSGAVKIICSVNRKFIVRMDKDQLLIVAQHIRTLC